MWVEYLTNTCTQKLKIVGKDLRCPIHLVWYYQEVKMHYILFPILKIGFHVMLSGGTT